MSHALGREKLITQGPALYALTEFDAHVVEQETTRESDDNEIRNHFRKRVTTQALSALESCKRMEIGSPSRSSSQMRTVSARWALSLFCAAIFRNPLSAERRHHVLSSFYTVIWNHVGGSICSLNPRIVLPHSRFISSGYEYPSLSPTIRASLENSPIALKKASQLSSISAPANVVSYSRQISGSNRRLK